MNRPAWRAAWWETGVAERSMVAWRGVEAQHVVSSLRLVDAASEQEVLEELLERSKPPLPDTRAGLHYLLVTPFRYRPQHESRFRAAGSPGIWYGAKALRTACAEVAYWRHRFIGDCAAFEGTELLTEHTFYQASVLGAAIDLMKPPWDAAHAAWTPASDYRQTQALAAAAQGRGIRWIAYASVRDPGGRCAAVLDAGALSLTGSDGHAQTWHCKATRGSVMLVRGAERYAWSF